MLYALLLVAIVGFTLLPLVGALGASMAGNFAGCRVDEAGSYPCVLLGTDIGGMLSVLFVMGWLTLATIPIGGLLFVLWAIAIAVHIFRSRHQ